MDQMTVALTAAEWNEIAAILVEEPYRRVAPLLAKMQAQMQAQREPPPRPASASLAAADDDAP